MYSISVGSSNAIELAKNGDVELVWIHEPLFTSIDDAFSKIESCDSGNERKTSHYIVRL